MGQGRQKKDQGQEGRGALIECVCNQCAIDSHTLDVPVRAPEREDLPEEDVWQQAVSTEEASGGHNNLTVFD